MKRKLNEKIYRKCRLIEIILIKITKHKFYSEIGEKNAGSKRFAQIYANFGQWILQSVDNSMSS